MFPGHVVIQDPQQNIVGASVLGHGGAEERQTAQ